MVKPKSPTTATEIEVTYTSVVFHPSEDVQRVLDKAFAIVFDHALKTNGGPPVLQQASDRIIKPYVKDDK